MSTPYYWGQVPAGHIQWTPKILDSTGVFRFPDQTKNEFVPGNWAHSTADPVEWSTVPGEYSALAMPYLMNLMYMHGLAWTAARYHEFGRVQAVIVDSNYGMSVLVKRDDEP